MQAFRITEVESEVIIDSKLTNVVMMNIGELGMYSKKDGCDRDAMRNELIASAHAILESADESVVDDDCTQDGITMAEMKASIRDCIEEVTE